MKQRLLTIIFTGLIFFVPDNDLSAQEINTAPTIEDPVSIEDMEIPFIDRDSDGINDLVQNGWGLRFVERYKKRQELWNQFNVEIIKDGEGKKVDTDGDGVGDIVFHDFMKQKMDELIDTDGDGEADTPLRKYLGGRFRSFDQDGDGLPDDMTANEVREGLKEMKQWRNEIHDRVNNGLPPFVDDDANGVPDNLPKKFQHRGGKK